MLHLRRFNYTDDGGEAVEITALEVEGELLVDYQGQNKSHYPRLEDEEVAVAYIISKVYVTSCKVA